MEQPEIQSRHRVVIPRIAQIQKPQHLLVDEVKPEEPVIRPPLAVHREIEDKADCAASPARATARRSPETRYPRERIAAASMFSARITACVRPRYSSPAATGKTAAINPFKKQPGPHRGPHQQAHRVGCGSSSSSARSRLHIGHRDRQRQNHVRNQNAREQKKPDATLPAPGPRTCPLAASERPSRRIARSPSTAALSPAPSECAPPNRAPRKS